jgi:1,2-phenylacetyl-CoA epoxidase catalytic subunit
MIFNISVWKSFVIWIQWLIKQWAKPATLTLTSSSFSDLTRSRSNLVIENALLCQ